MARHARETQRAYVERVLRSEGRVANYDVLYRLTFDDGSKSSITRLAPIVLELRKAGWAIDTAGGHGELAVYVLRSLPTGSAPPAWRCVVCGAVARVEPTPTLDNAFATGRCLACGAVRYFRKAA